LDRSTLPTFFDRLSTLLVTGKSNSPLKKTSVEEATPIQEPF
jgi:hypothetical protein